VYGMIVEIVVHLWLIIDPVSNIVTYEYCL
jgi:hypothetical protein